MMFYNRRPSGAKEHIDKGAVTVSEKLYILSSGLICYLSIKAKSSKIRRQTFSLPQNWPHDLSKMSQQVQKTILLNPSKSRPQVNTQSKESQTNLNRNLCIPQNMSAHDAIVSSRACVGLGGSGSGNGSRGSYRDGKDGEEEDEDIQPGIVFWI